MSGFQNFQNDFFNCQDDSEDEEIYYENENG